MMQINANWKIEADAHNTVLYERHKRHKDGQYIWLVAGYFSDVKNALHELVEQKIRQTKLKDLQSIVKSIDELHQMIDGLPSQINSQPLRRPTRAKEFSKPSLPLVKTKRRSK